MHVTSEPATLTPEQTREFKLSRDAFVRVAESVEGRRVLARIISWCGVLPGEQEAQPGGAELLNFDAGKRWIGGVLVRELQKFAPERWVEMEAERLQALDLAARASAMLPAEAEL